MPYKDITKTFMVSVNTLSLAALKYKNWNKNDIYV